MKLFNTTRIPTEVLRPIIMASIKGTGADHTDVAVQINPCRGRNSNGYARNTEMAELAKRPGKKSGKCLVECRGLIVVNFVTRSKAPYAMFHANDFFETLQHEWLHIRQYQDNRKKALTHTFSKRIKERRTRHQNRPEEIWVNLQLKVMEKEGWHWSQPYARPLLLSLAEIIEGKEPNEIALPDTSNLHGGPALQIQGANLGDSGQSQAASHYRNPGPVEY